MTLTKFSEIKSTLLSPDIMKSFEEALPKHMSIKRFTRVAIAAINQNSKLQEANRKTLYSSCMTAAQLGLFTDGFLGEAYLVPYKGAVQCQVGYRGFLKLARQSGEISYISAAVVYKNDRFSYELGDNEYISHHPTLEERGSMICVYAIAKFKDGSLQRVVLTKEDVMKIKLSSQGAGSKFSPWVTFEEEMWKKTAIKRLCKLLPLNTEAQQALAISDQTDIGKYAKLVDGELVVDSREREEKEFIPTAPTSIEDIIKADNISDTNADSVQEELLKERLENGDVIKDEVEMVRES